MKKSLFFAAALSLMVSCGNGSKGSGGNTAAESRVVVTDGDTYKLDDLLPVAESLVGKEVTVTGCVTHTCKHSGKRAFIVGESRNTSFRIEAKGNIGGFNRELTGSRLAVRGVVRERRLSREYLAQVEKDLDEEKFNESGSAETCEAELANIEDMKAWMKEYGKDYYAVYYMDGEDYEVLE